MTDYFGRVLQREAKKRANRQIDNASARALRNGTVYIPKPETQAAADRKFWRPKGLRPFVGVDGEGGGTNRQGQQHYRLLRAGARLLFNNNVPLTTVDCLEFQLSCPRRWIMVGFGFNYDATQILRDLPPAKIEQIMKGPPEGSLSRYTYWRNYAIDYLPGQYLRVARLDPNGGLVERSARTVWEVAGFFQCKFTEALATWAIGDNTERAKIAAVKDKRETFGAMTAELIDYNAAECRWLAAMMTEFRDRCRAAGIKPHTWNGAGKIASALLKKYNMPKGERIKEGVFEQVVEIDPTRISGIKISRRKIAPPLVPPAAYEYAEQAYFGGRAEVSWLGVLMLWAYDLRSAYPAAMLDLPCLEHSTWHKLTAAQLARRKEGEIFVADISFRHPKGQVWCGLPWRATTGGLRWPRLGRGTYWSVEIHAAERAGASIKYRSGWLCRKRCDCQPFGWLRDLYEERRRLEREGAGRGIPIKLGINSIYGKLAQRIGKAPYRNPVWAGLITAWTRARLLDAINTTDPKNVVALATDAVFSRVPLPLLDQGDELGAWEERELGPTLFLMPGVYWSTQGGEVTVKTRGMDKASLTRARRVLERFWHHWGERIKKEAAREGLPIMAPLPFPVVPVKMKSNFIGLRLAWARGDLASAGRWTKGEERIRRIAFAWHNKRTARRIVELAESEHGLAVLTEPHTGTAAGRSSTTWHRKSKQRALNLDADRYLIEDQPDYIDPAEELLGEAA